MNEQEKLQIYAALQNLEESKKCIPSFCDLEMHPVFGPVFSTLSEKQKSDVRELICGYISEKIKTLNKTKGGLLFQRFYENNNDLFWQFRHLNESEDSSNTPTFQEIGEKVEQELFKLEGILTEKMIKQEKGLDKVVESFYNIVYLFFPRYGKLT